MLRGKEAHWEICSNAISLISLPGGLGDLGVLLKLFPALSVLSKDHAFVLRDMPSLNLSAKFKWPARIAEELLNSVPVDPVTRDSDLLSALVRFCEHLKHELGNTIETAICALIQRMLSDEKVPLSRLRSNELNRVCFAALLELVSDSRKLWIPFRDDLVGESESLMHRLQPVVERRIVIPSVLDPRVLDPRKRSVDLNNDEAFKIFSELAIAEPKGGNEDGYRKLISEIVIWMFDAWPQAVHQILQEPICNLRLFYARDFSSQTNRKFTPFELYSAVDERRLFGRNAQLCDKLQSCVVDQAILYIDSPSSCFTKALGSDLLPCTPNNCTAFLGRRPKLIENLAPRVDLLQQLKSVGAEADWASIRYLFHGRRDPTVDQLSLIALDKSPWSKLAILLLETCSQSWRAIDDGHLDNLSSAEKRSLGIVGCIPATVAQLASDIDTSNLDFSSIGRDRAACSVIIRDWPADLDALLRRLPIFIKADGTLTAITDQTFINTGTVSPSSDVFPDFQLIEDPDGVLASRRLAPTLNSLDILRKLLEKNDSHKHWLYIMDQLDAAADPILKSLLGQTPWLTTQSGTAVSPKQVICEDTLASHIAKLKTLGATLIHQSELLPDLRAHNQWKRVAAELCPTKAALCRTIGDSVNSLRIYRVGAGTWQDGRLENLLQLFADSVDILPAIGLLDALRNLPGIGIQQLEDWLLPKIGTLVDIDRSVQALKHIQGRHVKATSAQRTAYMSIFNTYLDETLTQDGSVERLDGISLLNRAGEWRNASELAIEGHNIAPTSLVNAAQLEILNKHRFNTRGASDSQLRSEI